MDVSKLEGAELDAAVERAEGWVGAPTGAAPFAYSTNWEYAGEIIERERIAVYPVNDGWQASVNFDLRDLGEHDMRGPTPLIAAMRAFVASKQGA